MLDKILALHRSVAERAAGKHHEPLLVQLSRLTRCCGVHRAAHVDDDVEVTSTNPYAEGERMGQTGDPFKSRVITRGFGDNTDNDPMGKDYVSSPRSVHSFPGAGRSNILKYREKKLFNE